MQNYQFSDQDTRKRRAASFEREVLMSKLLSQAHGERKEKLLAILSPLSWQALLKDVMNGAPPLQLGNLWHWGAQGKHRDSEQGPFLMLRAGTLTLCDSPVVQVSPRPSLLMVGRILSSSAQDPIHCWLEDQWGHVYDWSFFNYDLPTVTFGDKTLTALSTGRCTVDEWKRRGIHYSRQRGGQAELSILIERIWDCIDFDMNFASSSSSSSANGEARAAPGPVRTELLVREPNDPRCVICQATQRQARLCSCAGCHKVSYCGVVCQKLGWPGHKRHCRKDRVEDSVMDPANE